MIVRQRLARYRQHGYGFEQAWEWALHLESRALWPSGGFDYAAWRDILEETKPAWRAAYVGEPPAPQDEALIRIATAVT